jgi:uncharacterized membrane protein
MLTPARIRNHPVHPMLVVFPIGLWVFAFVCDIVYVTWGSAVWKDAAFLAIGGGIIGAIAAAIPGFMDFRSLRDPRLVKMGLVHMSLNLMALLLFVVNWLTRWIDAPYSISITLSTVAMIGLVFSGWLGGEMVYVHGVGVKGAEPPPREGEAREIRSQPATRDGAPRSARTL